MGILYVLLFWLILFVLSGLVVCLLAGIISLFGKKETRKKRFKIALFAPAITIGTVVICTSILAFIVTSLTKTDIGIGDSFYVPLKNGYELLFVDSPEYGGNISHDGKTLLHDVSQIRMDGEKICGKNGEYYFILDTSTHKLDRVDSGEVGELLDATKFYNQRFWRLNGFGFVLIFLIDIILSFVLVRKVVRRINEHSALKST